MEAPPPYPVPMPAIAEEKGKPVVIRPPEVGSAHDFATMGWIITLLLSIPWVIISLVIGGFGLAAALGYLILPPVLPPALLSFPALGTFIAFVVFLLTPSYVVYLGLGVGGLIVALIFLGAIYTGIVRSISKGRYEKARGASLFWGILFIIPVFFVLWNPVMSGTVVALVPALFFLLTYGRLGEVIAKYGPVAVMGEAVPGMAGVPPVPAPLGAMAMGPGGPMPPMPPMAMGGPVSGMGPGGPMPPMPPMAGPPKNPQCPTCGKELYYSANHRRWYCQNCDNPGR
ncbi:MAG: hypothetical protein ABSD49_05040 [Candidatus Bathyarchaeia archaeon]|jgi:hypothetical protein